MQNNVENEELRKIWKVVVTVASPDTRYRATLPNIIAYS